MIFFFSLKTMMYNLGPYSQTILKNVLRLAFLIFLCLESLESNTTSD